MCNLRDYVDLKEEENRFGRNKILYFVVLFATLVLFLADFRLIYFDQSVFAFYGV